MRVSSRTRRGGIALLHLEEERLDQHRAVRKLPAVGPRPVRRPGRDGVELDLPVARHGEIPFLVGAVGPQRRVHRSKGSAPGLAGVSWSSEEAGLAQLARKFAGPADGGVGSEAVDPPPM